MQYGYWVMKIMFELFWAFAKIGSMTFGGGYAMMPIIQREIVDIRGWATDDDITDYYALSQCTPGAIAINTATFVGNKVAGRWGGFWASIGVLFPSVVIISIIAAFVTNFAHIPVVQHAFSGIRIAVCALITLTVTKLIRSNIKNAFGISIYCIVLILALLFNVSPALLAVGALLAGIAFARQ